MSKITQEELDDLKTKARKWDDLGHEIAKFYVDPTDSDDELDYENGVSGGYDLLDIGEAAAIAYGWL